MNIYFSLSEIGFFTSEIEAICKKAGAWPTDLVEITDEQYSEFSGTPPEGKKLGTSNGAPAWIDVPAPTEDELVSINTGEQLRLRIIADSEISWRQDAVDMAIATDEEITSLSEWKKYRVLLMRVNIADPEWPTPPATQV